MEATKVLVTGVTGQQGGAVVDALLSGEYGTYEVYGMTRDTESDRAAALAGRGVHVVAGDMNDRASLDAALEGMDSAYLVTTFFEEGPEQEAAQGRRFVDACIDADVGFVVYSSVAGADTAPLDHFASKARVEESLAASGLEWFVVRPAYFMQNFGWQAESAREGRLALPLGADVSLAVVDVGDIGRTVAMAFADSERWAGAVVEIAGDERTLEEFAAAFAATLGHDVTAVHLSDDEYRPGAGDELADMYAWFNAGGYEIDIDTLEAHTGHEYADFETYVEANWASPAAPV